MAYLFDTDAISESMRRAPLRDYTDWLATIPREDQFTSSVVMGELYKGAHRSNRRAILLQRIEEEILPRLTVLPYELEDAQVYGEIRAALEASGKLPDEMDLLIGATALRHGLRLVTGNIEHFKRIPGLSVESVLAEARKRDARDPS